MYEIKTAFYEGLCHQCQDQFKYVWWGLCEQLMAKLELPQSNVLWFVWNSMDDIEVRILRGLCKFRWI